MRSRHPYTSQREHSDLLCQANQLPTMIISMSFGRAAQYRVPSNSMPMRIVRFSYQSTCQKFGKLIEVLELQQTAQDGVDRSCTALSG